MISRNERQPGFQLDQLIRRALRARAETCGPDARGWERLHARIRAAQSVHADGVLTALNPEARAAGACGAERRPAPMFSFADEGYFTPGAISTWPQVDAAILSWRLNLGGLLSACRIV